MKIRVLIADDSPVMRRAVRQLLSEEPGIEIVGEAVSFAQMIEMKQRYQPEIVIMDLHMIGENDIPLGDLNCEGSQVLAISICDPEDGEREAKNLGASAFLDKLHLENTLVAKILELRQVM